MTAAVITSHVWRPSHRSGNEPATARHRCAYMNCRRPRTEHERAVLAPSALRTTKVGQS